MERILNSIHTSEDIKKLTPEQLEKLAREIRAFLLYTISKTGGHLASNLGVVELTLALHYCFCLPEDKLIFDVGHQAYVHKILTGRKKEFLTLRKFHGLSGFPKPEESPFDAFAVGHSSTSISAALGFACARDLRGETHSVIAVIGDGSMTGGLAFEALNNAGRSNRNLIVILNDNQMSISKNVGAVSRHLGEIRTKPAYLGAKRGMHTLLQKLPVLGQPVDRAIERTKNAIKYFFVSGVLFEEMGFRYVGPIDGHNLPYLIETLQKLKEIDGPILLHVHTTKGKGYQYAEKLPWEYHGVGTFDIKTGQPVKKTNTESYSDVFGNEMVRLAGERKNIVAISAAMTSGTGLDEFQMHYPRRFFDVGIAEQHAVTFAAGMAAQGFTPVFAVYSTFLQRAYDQIIHDVCLQNLHVIFAIDRAGIVGPDGETHQGIYDISYLTHIPNMTLLAPRDGEELRQMLRFAVSYTGPIAIRYPKGECPPLLPQKERTLIRLGEAEILKTGKKVALLAAGCMVKTALLTAERMEKDGYSPYVINMRFLKPLDETLLLQIAKDCQLVVSLEDNLRAGGMGAKVLEFFGQAGITGIRTCCFAFQDTFVPQGTREELFAAYGLDELSIYKEVKKLLQEVDEGDGCKGKA